MQGVWRSQSNREAEWIERNNTPADRAENCRVELIRLDQ
jgi:hypothetical protein